MCTEDDCTLVEYRRGICQKHYRAQMNPAFHARTEAERFWSFVDKTGSCWLWTGGQAGGQDNRHYGSFRRSPPDGRQVYAHRVAWELTNGPIPAGLTIDHMPEAGCTSTLCQNPAHMQLVTRSRNSQLAAERRAAR